MFAQPSIAHQRGPSTTSNYSSFSAGTRTTVSGAGVVPDRENRDHDMSGSNRTTMTSTLSENSNQAIAQYHRAFCHFLGLDPIERMEKAAIATPPATNKARQKLLKLSKSQFEELSNDVYDELRRRTNPSPLTPSYLPPSDEFHAKRNQARQKLSILSTSRFNDLGTDILCEIERRYPFVAENHRALKKSSISITSLMDGGGNRFPASNVEPSPVKDRNAELPALPTESPSPEDFESATTDFKTTIEPPSIIGPEHRQEHNLVDAKSKPVAQSLKPAVIVPTKSTLVEEDEDEEEEEDEKEEEAEELRETEDIEDDADSLDEQITGQSHHQGHNREASIFNNSITLDSIIEDEGEADHVHMPAHPIRTLSQLSTNIKSGQITPPDLPESNNISPQNEVAGDGYFGNPVNRDFSELDDFQAQLNDKDEQIQMLVDEGSRMDEAINKLEAQLSESETMKNTLVEENGRLHEMIGQVEEEKLNISDELAQVKHNHELELSNLRDQLRDTEEKYASVEADHLQLKDSHEAALSKQLELTEYRENLTQQIGQLESKVSGHQSTIDSLKSDLKGKENDASSSAELEGLQRKHDQLKLVHSNLREELDEQQKVTDQVREEAAAFLEEMRALAENQHSGWDNSVNLNAQMQELKVEVQEWKSRYLRAKSQVRNLRASTYGGISGGTSRNVFQASTAPVEKDSPYYDSEYGRIRDISVTKFQMAMDEFLTKSRTDAGNLLDHLHNLVVATRKVTQDITDGEDRTNDSREDLQSEIAQCTSLVSTTANHLITTTRNHTTSGGLAPISILDAAASDLSSAVIDLIKVAKIRPQSPHDDEMVPPRGRNSNDPDLDQGGEVYTSGASGDEEALGGLGISSEAESGIDNVITVKKRERQPIFRKPSLPLQPPEVEFDIDDPDNTVAELQAYLEEKTVTVIDSIQNLLTGIRDNAKMDLLRRRVVSITSSVDFMVEATGTSMKQSRNWLLKDKGSYILQNLADCSQRMSNLEIDSEHLSADDHPDRHLKQRLAGISFDMAKCTKELVKTVEEVSLTNDVHHLDKQLAKA